MSGIVGSNLGRGSGLVKATPVADESVDSDAYVDGSVDLAHLQTGTDGQIITWNASGNAAAVGPGSDGEVLTSTGAGSPPAFEAAAGGGKVLQVVSTAKTDTYSSTSPDTFENITGFTVAITPAATSSKVLVFVSVGYSGSTGNNTFFRLVRGTTAIGVGDAIGARERAWFKLPRSQADQAMTEVAHFTFLDSPSSTSEETYALQIGGTGDSAQMYINRTHYDASNNETVTGCSTITAMEIGA